MNRKISKNITGKDYFRILTNYKRQGMSTKPFLRFNNNQIFGRDIDEKEIFTYSDLIYIKSLQIHEKNIMKKHI